MQALLWASPSIWQGRCWRWFTIYRTYFGSGPQPGPREESYPSFLFPHTGPIQYHAFRGWLGCLPSNPQAPQAPGKWQTLGIGETVLPLITLSCPTGAEVMGCPGGSAASSHLLGGFGGCKLCLLLIPQRDVGSLHRCGTWAKMPKHCTFQAPAQWASACFWGRFLKKHCLGYFFSPQDIFPALFLEILFDKSHNKNLISSFFCVHWEH